ncbi:TetR/AcrR family transcriptional regulator [Deltaproteobacteria bacterium]|nr:TetR/AcrR family transcriptional regulator [Deltaproteobacteria bacterium]
MRTKILKEKRDESIRRILDAAMEIFAESGYEGARIDEIAKRAGVNKAMIYYRIGDKKTLYGKILHDVFGDTAERIARNINEDHPPEEKLRAYIINLAGTIAQHPHLPNIMMREIASGGGLLNETVINELAGILVILKKILDEGVEKNMFIETNPLMVHMMVIGAMIIFKASEPVREKHHHLLSGRLGDQENSSLEAMAREVEKLVLRALKI